jgi:hypothetical protein
LSAKWNDFHDKMTRCAWHDDKMIPSTLSSCQLFTLAPASQVQVSCYPVKDGEHLESKTRLTPW